MTISDRVIAYLKEQPGNPMEIGKALELTMRSELSPWLGYRWGKWSFDKAERGGLIEWIDGKWHLKEVRAI